MNTVAAILLIVTPILFNVFFALLAKTFEYPTILRLPSREVLERFHRGGTRLRLTWQGFATSALLFVPVAVLTGPLVGGAPEVLVTLTVTVGVFAGLVQTLGLIRWPFLVPYLARVAVDESESEATREAAGMVFQAFNRYLGVAVGEHLGYLATGSWTILFSAALLVDGSLPVWVAIAGIAIGASLVLGSLEFVGSFEDVGWRVAGILVPIGYTLWSAWLLVLGVVVLLV